MKTLNIDLLEDFLGAYLISDKSYLDLKEWIDSLSEEELKKIHKEKSFPFCEKVEISQLKECMKEVLYEDTSYLIDFFKEFVTKTNLPLILESNYSTIEEMLEDYPELEKFSPLSKEIYLMKTTHKLKKEQMKIKSFYLVDLEF